MHQDLSVLDLEFGIAQLSGNRDLLIKLLGNFKTEYLNAADSLAKYIAEGDAKSAKNMIHTLKGVAGNLGMNKLHAQCKASEQTLLAGDITRLNLDLFSQTMSDTFAKITELENGTDVPPSRAASAPLEASALVEALQKNEYIPGDKLEAMLASVELPEDKKQLLAEAINDLDYAAALTILGA